MFVGRCEEKHGILDTIVRLLKDTIGFFAMFPTAQMCLSRSEKWCLRKIDHGLGLFSIQHNFSAFQVRCCFVLFSSFDHRPSLSKTVFEVWDSPVPHCPKTEIQTPLSHGEKKTIFKVFSLSSFRAKTLKIVFLFIFRHWKRHFWNTENREK